MKSIRMGFGYRISSQYDVLINQQRAGSFSYLPKIMRAIIFYVLGFFFISAAYSQSSATPQDNLIPFQSGLSEVLSSVLWIGLLGFLIFTGLLLFTIWRLRQTIHILRENASWADPALNGGEAGIWEIDIPRRRHHIDEKTARMFGYSPEEVGQDLSFWQHSVHPEDYERIMETFRVHQEKRIPSCEVDCRIRTKQGRWIRVCAEGKITEWDSEGQPLRISGTLKNITKRKETERILREYERITSLTNDLLACVDRNYIYTAANAAYLNAYHKAGEQVIGHPVEELFETEVYEETIKPHLDRCLAGEKITYESWMTLPGTGRRFVRATYNPVRDRDGRTEEIVICIHDMTETREAIESLKQSEGKYRSLIETCVDWIWEVNAQGIYTYSSPQSKTMLGYDSEEILGKTPFALMPPEEAERVQKQFEVLSAARQPIRGLQNTVLHKNGHPVLLETNGVPIFDSQGQYAGFRGIDRDITERQRAQQVLRERDEEIRAIVETSRDWIWAMDVNGIHTFSNNAVQDILGYSPEEILGKSIEDFIHPDDLREINAKLQSKSRDKEGWKNRRVRWKHKDGSYRCLESNAILIFDSRGQLLGFRGVDRDITERIQAEEVLRNRTQQLERFERLAVGREMKMIELKKRLKEYEKGNPNPQNKRGTDS